MMQKKGFTLIELLAVIVILAVIAVIATPIVIDSIATAKKGALKDSVYGVIKAAENYYATQFDATIPFTGATIDLATDTLLKYKGEKLDGTLVIDSAGKIVIKTWDGSNCALKAINTDEVTFDTSKLTRATCLSLSGVDPSEITHTFAYTEGAQTFTAPADGTYKIELWGAEGSTAEPPGGKGGYTAGEINLTNNAILYVYVGGKGNNYNGGGSSPASISATLNEKAGGGATDVRLVSGVWSDFASLKSRIMVAGGGGGVTSAVSGAAPGNAGGLVGFNGSSHTGMGADANTYLGSGGTQTSGGAKHTSNLPYIAGTSGGFGYGGNAGVRLESDPHVGGAGGGGYYGGGGAAWHAGGGGGSSFISGFAGCNAITAGSTSGAITHSGTSLHYSGYVFTNGVMIPGNTPMPLPVGGSELGHTGNGYARITLLSGVVTEPSLTTVEALIVAGGGGGGTPSCNAGVNTAGGAGGLLYNVNYTVYAGDYNIVVGSGGAQNTNGGNSSLGALALAIGGGRGGIANGCPGDATANGALGGSGGSSQSYFGGFTYNGGLGTSGQGYAGSSSPSYHNYSTYVTGGGGGAGGAGGNVGGSYIPGNGGVGLEYSISGTPTYYAGGGAGQSQTICGTHGNGAIGGGGDCGGAGANGIVIIRYLGPLKADGGAITSDSVYTTHTFTTNGTFKVW